MSCKLNRKLPFRIMMTSSYRVHDYTTGGHTDLGSIYRLFIQYIYIYIQYMYISIQYTNLLLLQYKGKRYTSTVFGMVHSDRTVVVLPQTFQFLI